MKHQPRRNRPLYARLTLADSEALAREKARLGVRSMSVVVTRALRTLFQQTDQGRAGILQLPLTEPTVGRTFQVAPELLAEVHDIRDRLGYDQAQIVRAAIARLEPTIDSP